ncbi:MAG: serine/threonine protein kinase [Alphaproteobacteria bacterium]|nr:serine/threonine protein kinase [Alphaproteobacteria bacterium]
MDLPSGEVVADRYRIQEPIGFGGAGDVYEVRDTRLGTTLALKLLYEDQLATNVLRQRFLTEARIMAELQHPHILPVYDLGEHAGRVFFVMEHCPLGNVREHFREEGSVQLAVKVAVQVLGALEHAHANGCIHRDVKPANVLRFENDLFKLADFGVARYDAAGVARHTRTGDYLGTLGYMSPEQRADPRRVEPPSDLYAAGAMLYALLSGTGRPPPDLYALDIDEHRLPGVPAEVRAAVERSTRARAEDRFPDAAAMRMALEHALVTCW